MKSKIVLSQKHISFRSKGLSFFSKGTKGAIVSSNYKLNAKFHYLYNEETIKLNNIFKFKETF